MTDRFTVRAVVVGLIGLGLIFGAGIVYLAQTGHDHGVLDNLVSVVVGALSGVLAKTNTDVPSQPTPVTVVDQPVATTEVPATRKRDRGDSLVVILCLVVVVVVIAALIGAIQ